MDKKVFVDVLMCCAFCSGQEQEAKMIALVYLCRCRTGFVNGVARLVAHGKSMYTEKEAAKTRGK